MTPRPRDEGGWPETDDCGVRSFERSNIRGIVSLDWPDAGAPLGLFGGGLEEAVAFGGLD